MLKTPLPLLATPEPEIVKSASRLPLLDVFCAADAICFAESELASAAAAAGKHEHERERADGHAGHQ